MTVPINTVTVDFLRKGPPHNQLLSPLTEYLGICGESGAGSVAIPYEQATFNRQLSELRYADDDEDDQAPRQKEIERYGLKPGDHRRYRQFLARHPTQSTNVPQLAAMEFRSDSSKPNGSSIALLAKYDGTAVLLAGDAHAPVLTQSIGQLLEKRGQDRLRLDAFKVSHHGSRGNTNAKLLGQLDCARYLISCNSDVHNLPDNETIGRIIHMSGPRPEVIFNYECGRTKAWSDSTLKQRYGYRANYGRSGHYRLNLKG